MDFGLTEEQLRRREQFVEVCRELDKKKPPNFTGLEGIYDTDEGMQYHLYCAGEFAKRGWLALGWPPEYGGTGTITDRVFLSEARGYYDIPGVDVFGVSMLAPTLIAAGSEEIKREFLPKIAAGEIMFCELWSEPNAGSDLAALSTSAVREGDEYVINGQKIWSSGAHRADWAFALVKTNPKAERKQEGITFILFDMKTPGITVSPLHFMDGGHLYNEVFFDNVRVPAKYVVGEEHKGWQVTQMLAGFERSGLEAIMGLRRLIDDLVAYCNETVVDGEPLSKNPIIRNRVAEVACQVEALRALAYKIVDQQARDEMGAFDAAAVKVFAGDTLSRLAPLGVDILGTYGQLKSSRWAKFGGFYEKMYQQYFIMTIAMGTNEVLRNIIAWYALGLPRVK